MSRIIRIMHVIRPAAGGMKNHLLALIEQSDRGKFEHMVACPENMVDSFACRGVRTFCIPINGELSLSADLAIIGKLVMLLKKQRVDIVHAHSFKAGLVGRLAAKVAGTQAVVLTVHNSICNEQWSYWKRLIFNVCESVLFACTDRIITVSESLRQEIFYRLKTSSEKIITIYNGIIVEDFDLTPDRNYLQKTTGIPVEKVIVGTVSRLAVQKGVGNIIKAAAELSLKDKQISYLVVGDGPLRAELEREAEELKVSEQFFFSGERHDINRILPCLDVFVLASLTEGFPLTILEAMASRCPVVATKVGGIPEIINNGINGLLVNPGDISALAKAIKTMILEPKRSKDMGDVGRQQVIKEYTVEKMIVSTERIYLELVH